MKNKNDSIKKLEKTIQEFSRHNFFNINSSFRKIFLVSLFRGLVSGFGWVLGATILVSLFTYALSQIEFIPILGNYAHQIIEIIERLEKKG